MNWLGVQGLQLTPRAEQPEKSGAFAPGVGVDTSPQVGCCRAPDGALG